MNSAFYNSLQREDLVRSSAREVMRAGERRYSRVEPEPKVAAASGVCCNTVPNAQQPPSGKRPLDQARAAFIFLGDGCSSAEVTVCEPKTEMSHV